MPRKNITTPNDLAESLAGAANREIVGKRVRSELRRIFPREVKNVSWVLTDEQVATITAWWNARKAGKNFDAQAFLKQRRSRKRASKQPKNAPTNDA